jgi:hypothetical protein
MKNLTESTGIQLSLAITLMGFALGAVWWASAVEQKVATVVKENESIIKELKTINKNLTEIKVVLGGKHGVLQSGSNDD